MKNLRTPWAYVVAFAVGLGVCLAVSKISGRREAWDSPMYFTTGIPAMALVSFILSYLDPRPLHWAVAMAVGQSLALVLSDGSFSLWPLAMIAMLVCSFPQFAAGWVGAKLRARKDRRN